jgi:hypothetical protein
VIIFSVWSFLFFFSAVYGISVLYMELICALLLLFSLNAKTPYQTSPSDAAPVKKEPESQAWLGLGPNAVKSNLSLS